MTKRTDIGRDWDWWEMPVMVTPETSWRLDRGGWDWYTQNAMPAGWYVIGYPPGDIDPLIHSLRWVKRYPFLAASEAEIWRDDFDPVAKWVKPQKTQEGGLAE